MLVVLQRNKKRVLGLKCINVCVCVCVHVHVCVCVWCVCVCVCVLSDTWTDAV